MILPFKGLYIFTQEFGVNAENYAKFLVLYPDGQRHPMKGHNGLDFATPHRTELVAPHDGTIIETNSDPSGYGWYVKIENEKEGSVLAHMDTIDVRVGFKLKEGDHIGWSDNTGNSTGPHCHWGYYTLPRDRANGEAGFVDQTPILKENGIHLVLGQLPEIENVGSNLSEMKPGEYKGIDLTNVDSVKAAIDAWYDVAHGKYKTAEEYQALETQLGEVRTQLGDTQKLDANVAVDLKNYNELKAVGYNNTDDVAKALKAKDDLNIALQTENAKIRARNAVLAGEIQKIEEEDHTTADLGQKTLDQNTELQSLVTDIAKTIGAEKPSQEKIMEKVFNLKDIADIWLKSKSDEEKARNNPIAKIKDAMPSFSYNANWFLDKLGLRKVVK